MKTRRNRPVEITDAPEHRSIPIDRIELRDASDNSNEIVLTGYASTFEEYDMYGGPSAMGWIERIDPGAFEKTLREKPDLHLLINHAGMPLARTKSGTLDLVADDHGLHVTARLDKRDPEAQALSVKMARGDMNEMSFAFRVKGQEWRAAPGFEEIDDQSYRTITEVSLHKGDVSVVNWGANPTTSAEIKSAPELLRALAECDADEFAEVRDDSDLLMRVAERLFPKLVESEESDEEREDEETEEREDESDESEESEERDDESEDEEFWGAKLARVLIEVVERMDEIEALLGVESEEREEVDEVEETEGEATDESEPRGMTLAEALAQQGVVSESRLSLAAALALETA
jgi:HK97 family phage prohead protease